MATTIKIIDRFNGFAILKITNSRKTYYQTMPEAHVGKDASESVQHATLGDARRHLTMPAAKSEETLPKSAYPQNTKGYDPHRAR